MRDKKAEIDRNQKYIDAYSMLQSKDIDLWTTSPLLIMRKPWPLKEI